MRAAPRLAILGLSAVRRGSGHLEVAEDRSVGEALGAIWIAVEDIVHAIDKHFFRPVVAINHDERRRYHDMASSDVMPTRMESTAGPVILRPRRRRVVHKRSATMRALWCFWCGLVLWSSSWRRCRSRVGVVSVRQVLRLWSVLRISRGVAALCLRRVSRGCLARGMAIPSAVGSREGCYADCGACEARDQEFLEVVVHIAPSLSFLDVAQEGISRLHPVRHKPRRLLTKFLRTLAHRPRL